MRVHGLPRRSGGFESLRGKRSFRTFAVHGIRWWSVTRTNREVYSPLVAVVAKCMRR